MCKYGLVASLLLSGSTRPAPTCRQPASGLRIACPWAQGARLEGCAASGRHVEGGGCPAPSPAAPHWPEGTGTGGTGHLLVLRLCPEEGSAQHLPHGKPQKQKTGSHTLPLLRNSTTGRTRVKKASRWWPEPWGGRERAPRGLGKF